MACIENQELINKAKSKGIPQWRIAEELGVSEMTLVRWLRHPLESEKKDAYLKAVESIPCMKKPKVVHQARKNQINGYERSLERYADSIIAEVNLREKIWNSNQ